MRDVRAAAGALAALVGLLLREVHLDVSRVDGRPEVDGPQGVRGAHPLADQRGGAFRLPLALLPVSPLVLGLALTRRLSLVLVVVLVPQPVALGRKEETENKSRMQKFVEKRICFMPK